MWGPNQQSVEKDDARRITAARHTATLTAAVSHQAAHANKELAMQLKEMRRHIAHLSSLVDPASA